MIKRGQVTLFIIIGILIIGIGVSVFMLNTRNEIDEIDRYFTSADVKPKYDFLINSIQDCLKITATDAIDLIGIQGGYYKEPADVEILDLFFIPYYYDKGRILIPTRTEIEKELAMYVDENLDSCFSEIEDDFFQVSYKESKTEPTITNGQVSFIINMDVKIQKDKKIANINTNNDIIVIKTKLNEIYEIAKYITDSHKEDSEMICINCVADMAKERDLYVDMFDYDVGTTLITIYDNSTSAETYVYEFLNRY